MSLRHHCSREKSLSNAALLWLQRESDRPGTIERLLDKSLAIMGPYKVCVAERGRAAGWGRAARLAIHCMCGIGMQTRDIAHGM